MELVPKAREWILSLFLAIGFTPLVVFAWHGSITSDFPWTASLVHLAVLFLLLKQAYEGYRYVHRDPSRQGDENHPNEQNAENRNEDAT